MLVLCRFVVDEADEWQRRAYRRAKEKREARYSAQSAKRQKQRQELDAREKEYMAKRSEEQIASERLKVRHALKGPAMPAAVTGCVVVVGLEACYTLYCFATLATLHLHFCLSVA